MWASGKVQAQALALFEVDHREPIDETRDAVFARIKEVRARTAAFAHKLQLEMATEETPH
jgi:hypothetical protein